MSGAPLTAEQVLRRRKLVLFGDIILLLFGSVLYSWSVFVTPLEGEFGWLRTQTSLTFTIASGVCTIFGYLSAVLARKIGSQWVTRIFGVVATIGLLGAATTQSLGQLYLCYGILLGGAIGSLYNQGLATVVLWFRDKASFVTGVLLMCYGMGSMVISPLVSRIMVSLTWRGAFTVLAVMALCISLFSSFMTRKPTAEEEMFLPMAPEQTVTKRAAGKDYTPGGMIRTVSFWVFLIWNLSVGLIGLSMSSQASPMAQAIGITEGTAALYVGAYSLANGIGRVSFGFIFDRIGRRRCTVLVSCIGIAATGLLLVVFQMGSAAGMLIAYLLLGLTFSGGPVCSASVMRELFGEKNYGMNLGFGNLAILGSSFAGPLMVSLLYEKWGYSADILFMASFAAISLVFALILAKRQKI